jgi:DNA polymerase-3 subunit gamma/tau
MSYLVLARKWRPQVFEDLIGQEPLVRILTNSITKNKLAHAYVFSGPRGIGKTSTARILSKALNCSEGPTPTPCGRCDSCKSVAEGSSVDVIEIDGASNNSVDNIRDLRERVKYAPSSGRYKVYIIDEAHMLSTSAFNALLKTLEEPPPHVLFVLATTEARKIPATVLSRCQHLPFRRVSTKNIKERLKTITSAEGISASDGALALMARAADGSIRDSLTILDQVSSFSSDISEEEIRDMIEIADFKSLASVAGAVISGERPMILDAVAGLVEFGTDMRSFTKDLIRFFRDLLVMRIVKQPEGLIDASAEEIDALKGLASQVSEEHLALILSELVKAEADVKSSFSPRVSLEMWLLKLSYLSRFRSINEAIAAVTKSKGAAIEYDIPYEKAAKPDAAMEEETTPDPDDEDSTVSTAADMSTAPPAKEPDDSKNGCLGTFTAKSLLQAIGSKLGDDVLASKLEKARPELEAGVLKLFFSSSDADICAKPFKDDPARIEAIASSLCDTAVTIEIHIKQPSQSMSRKDVKDQAMKDPLVREAMDLFDSRIVDIKKRT